MNLFSITLNSLLANKRLPRQVSWVEANGKGFSWEDFKTLADKDFDPRKVNDTLKIVGTDFIMTWTKDDISAEWWFTEIMPEKPKVFKTPTSPV